MNLVLDASAAVEVVLNRAHAPLFRRSLEEADVVVAPSLMLAEVASALWKLHRFSGVPGQSCADMFDAAAALPDAFVSETHLAAEAFSLSCQLGHSVYDMHYVVLARGDRAALATLDRKLAEVAAALSVQVVTAST